MDFNAIATECAPWVAPQTLAAIVRTESQFQPLAIGVNGGGRLVRQPASKEEAVVTAKWLIANKYNIDMGLGQVNSSNLKRIGLTVEDAFDPCRNLAAAATILTWNYQSASRRTNNQQAALHAAISAYNTGSFTRGFSNGYVQKVLNNSNLIQGANASTAGLTIIKPIALADRTNKATPATPSKKIGVEKKSLKKHTAPTNPASTNQQAVTYLNDTAAVDQGIMVYAD